jgi:hypothetical protein
MKPITCKFGFDSRSANCVGTSGGLTIENYAMMHHIMRLCRHTITVQDWIAGNLGIGGNTSRDALPRLLTEMAKGGVDLWILKGPTNDRGSAAFDAWTSIDNCTQMQSAALANGARVLWIVDSPRGNTTFPSQAISGTQLTNHQIVRRWMLAQDTGHTVRVSDSYPALVDASSTAGYLVNGYSIDGLHDDPVMAYLEAKPAATIIMQMFPGRDFKVIATNADLFSASNPYGALNANPMVKNTGSAGTLGTGGAGVYPGGWTGANASGATGVTRTGSYDADGVWRCTLSGSASGTAAALDILKQTGFQTALTPGAQYEAFADMEVDAGATNISSLQLGIETIDPTNGTLRYWDGDRYLGTTLIHSGADTGLWRSPRITIPAGLTAGNLRLTSYATDAAASVALAVRVKACWLKQVEPQY